MVLLLLHSDLLGLLLSSWPAQSAGAEKYVYFISVEG